MAVGQFCSVCPFPINVSMVVPDFEHASSCECVRLTGARSLVPREGLPSLATGFYRATPNYNATSNGKFQAVYLTA